MFGLPITTVVDQPLYKNVFDTQLKPQYRQLLSALVARMTWCNKLSAETTALPACDLEEIEVFDVVLKDGRGYDEEISMLLCAIDRVIPYYIIWRVDDFVVFNGKHRNAGNEDACVIDWIFAKALPLDFCLPLHNSLNDARDCLCRLLSARPHPTLSYSEIIAAEKQHASFLRQIRVLETKIAKTTQFNKRVELVRQRQILLSKLSDNPS